MRKLLTMLLFFMFASITHSKLTAGVVIESGRITSWTLSTAAGGLDAGDTVSFYYGAYSTSPFYATSSNIDPDAAQPWKTNDNPTLGTGSTAPSWLLANALKTEVDNAGLVSSLLIAAYTFIADDTYGFADYLASAYDPYRSGPHVTSYTPADTSTTVFSSSGSELVIAYIATSGSTVPEPSTAIAMGLLGIVGFAGNRRRRRQVSAA